MSLRLPVLPKHFKVVTNCGNRFMPEWFTEIYEECLPYLCETLEPKDGLVPRMKVYALMADTIIMFHNFYLRYCAEYVTTISYLEQARMLTQDPKLREICHVELQPHEDSKEAEIMITNKSNELIRYISDTYPHTNLGANIITESINFNQLAQLLIAFGPRADINDKIIGRPILSNGINGLRDVYDYAKESLASKKAAKFNHEVVSKSSYFNRKGHLSITELYRFDPRICNNSKTKRIFIVPKRPKRYIGKNIIVDGVMVTLDMNNIKKFEGTIVNMVSALDCQHAGNVCSRCAGKMYYYIPNDFHLGLIVSTEIYSRIVQKILSAKHLVKTLTLLYNLNDSAKRWFRDDEDGYKLISKMLKGWSIGVRYNQMKRPEFVDIDHMVFEGEENSWISHILIFDEEGKPVDEITLIQEDNPIVPYFSRKFYEYVQKYPEYVTYKDRMCYIKMDNWRPSAPVLNVTKVSYDMTAYVGSVEKFMLTKAASYTDGGEALNDLCEIIFSKTEINIFLIEMILRTLLIRDPEDYEFPVGEREEDTFGKMHDIIFNRSFTPRLAFERLVNKSSAGNLHKPSTYIKPLSPGLFRPFLNL